jgi:hypothetical protein
VTFGEVWTLDIQTCFIAIDRQQVGINKNTVSNNSILLKKYEEIAVVKVVLLLVVLFSLSIKLIFSIDLVYKCNSNGMENATII